MIYWDCHALAIIKKKHPVSSSSTDRNSMLEKGQWRIARLIQADRNATVTQLTVLYNCGEQTNLSECTIR